MSRSVTCHLAALALFSALPAIAVAGPAEEIATSMVVEICAPSLPDFASAIEMGVDQGFDQLDNESILVDDATNVSLTVVPASKTFLVISVPPLCVVSLPAPGAEVFIPTAEAMATRLGKVTNRDGSTETLEDDGMSWTISRDGSAVDLQLLEDHSLFGDRVIFALIDYGAQ